MTRGLGRWSTVAACVAGLASASLAEVIVKANNTTNLDQTASWVGAKVPGPGDVAQWDYTVTSGATYNLGSGLSWSGIYAADTMSNGFTIAAGNTLTLGEAGITTVPDKGVTLNNAVLLAADQTWNIAKNTFISAGGLDMGGRRLTLVGSGAKQFKNAISGGGRIVNDGSGWLKFSSGAVNAPTTDFVLNNVTLNIETSTGVASAARTGSITLNGGELQVGGNKSYHTVETNANALTVGPGTAIVTVTPNSAKNAMFYSGSFARAAGSGAALFRGTGLGTNTLASLTTNSANIVFGAAPALAGTGAAGSTTCGVLVGAYADTSASGSGIGLATYDAIYGLRPLNFTTEYAALVTSGQSQLDNVRYVNTSGSGVITNTLSADTAINSLSFNITGAGSNSGVTLAGASPDRQLTLNSGMIFAQQTVTTAAGSDAMVLTNLTLNLNGHEGIFVAFTAGLNQGNSPAALYICGAITNDGGNGVTIGGIGTTTGIGETIFSGAATNTYTGVTTVNSGAILRLNKSAPNTGIPGNLVMNGNGILLKNSEAISDTADVTLNNSSQLYFDTTRSSGNNNHYETFSNLYMNGGAIVHNSGKDSTLTLNGNAVISANSLNMNSGGDLTVKGVTVLNGGRLTVSASSSTASTNAFFTLNALVITNTASGAYTPVVANANASNKGGLLQLNGDVTFAGNVANTNTAAIASSDAALANQGTIALSGARTFTVGNGAAATDLAVLLPVVNAANTNGGLTKAGAGTLALGAACAYSGATSVEGGTLAVNGGIASPVTVSGGTVLTGTGFIAPTNATAVTVAADGVIDPGTAGAVGTLTVTGGVFFASASHLRVDAAAGGADLLSVAGPVSAGSVSVDLVGSGSGPWLILSASGGITGTFTTGAPGLTVSKRNGNTELWLAKRQGTLVSVL